jgi:hypothetical protein
MLSPFHPFLGDYRETKEHQWYEQQQLQVWKLDNSLGEI